jgi:xanthine/CO dehydrogenase XdhC/CoxF family maturation factor
MTNIYLRNITNHFQDVRLASLSTWKRAHEITPRDSGGPYVVLQQGYDPEDMTMTPDEFVLGRSGKWLSLGHFFKMPIPDRRDEYIFGTAAEVMQMMSNLPSKAQILRPQKDGKEEAIPEQDEMAAAFHAHKP